MTQTATVPAIELDELSHRAPQRQRLRVLERPHGRILRRRADSRFPAGAARPDRPRGRARRPAQARLHRDLLQRARLSAESRGGGEARRAGLPQRPAVRGRSDGLEGGGPADGSSAGVSARWRSQAPRPESVRGRRTGQAVVPARAGLVQRGSNPGPVAPTGVGWSTSHFHQGEIMTAMAQAIDSDRATDPHTERTRATWTSGDFGRIATGYALGAGSSSRDFGSNPASTCSTSRAAPATSRSRRRAAGRWSPGSTSRRT